MDNIDEGDEPDFDIIQLLNTKKRNKEILFITNSAAEAVAGHQPGKAKVLSTGKSSGNHEESKENFDTGNTSSLSTSRLSESIKDVSFSGKHKVRVPSRLLREIKSPSERSISENSKSTDEPATPTTSSLFSSSSSSSKQSSIQASGPIPTVIKYSSESPQLDHKVMVSHQRKRHRSPVVIKHSEKFATSSPQQLDKSDFVGRNATKKTSYEDTQVVISKPLTSNCEDVVSTSSNGEIRDNTKHMEDNGDRKSNIKNSQRSMNETQEFMTGRPKEPSIKMHGTALCQGAPSNNLVQIADTGKGQVKALSFSVSDKEKATKEILSKRQETKAAIRRVVQPKLVTGKSTLDEKQVKEEVSSGVTPNVGVSGAMHIPTVQLPSALETKIGDLVSTLDAIESKCQESRDWQVLQQQQLEKNLKERDERRLQHLEDMQRQLLECQLKYARSIPPAAPYPFPSTSSASGTTQGLSTIQEQPHFHGPTTTEFPPGTRIPPTSQSTIHVQPTIPDHRLVGAPVGTTRQNLSQGSSTDHLPPYNVALEHKTPSTFKTSVYNKPTNVISHSGLKRKLVRNTRTQTSPQYSSSSSSTETSSPLETPLPRKRPPVPMAQVSKNERDSSRKHVHFDTPNTKTTRKPVKEKETQHETKAKRPPSTMGGPNQITYPISAIRRGETSPLKKPGSSDYIVNDIGKLRQELKDALKETEQTKLSLRNLHDNIHAQISDDDVLSVPDHTQPYPLDAYLRATRDIPEEPVSAKMEETVFPESGVKSNEPEHCTDAAIILRDVQRRKEMLESNLTSLTRQHEEQHLYRLVDDLASERTTSEAIRIRKEVAKRIDEISTVVQTELQDEEHKICLEKEATVENKKSVKFGSKSRVPSSAERRAKIRNTGKENQPGAKLIVKTKPSKPVAKQSVSKRPLEDLSYVSRVYGRQDHVPRRTTVKSSLIQHQSPVAPAAGRDSSKYRRWNDSVSSTDDSIVQHVKSKPRYYFQPSLINQATMKPRSKVIQTPLPGQLLSMAIPLGKPKTDPSLRLPVNTAEATSEPSPVKAEVVRSLIKQPNVAVITIKDENSLLDDDEHKKRKKAKKPKESIILETQVLPNVDIDTSSASGFSESPPGIGPHIVPCPDPPRRPGASEYEEFKDYEGVRDVKEIDDEHDDKEDAHNVISLHGESKVRVSSYEGPAFPPQNVPPHLCDGFEGAGAEQTPVGETVEGKALEWIEKELLARVVSEMAPPRPDPTSSVQRSHSSLSDTDSTGPDLLAAIGLRGIQLFVDAGVPVDNELVHNLILEVLKEKVASMLGYPKPKKQPSSERVQEKSADDYTDFESESEEVTRVETPVRTPSAASQLASGRVSNVSTPEQTIGSELSSLSPGNDVVLKDTTNLEDDEIEEGRLDNSVHGSPVPTPVVTPTMSPRSSPQPVHTPEPSEQEPPESEKTDIATPEMTVSTQKTQDETAEEDLKEQTFIDESSEDEEVKETDEVLPTVKFVVEPSEAIVTNSPSSITTTTYSTRSTLGTVATDDEISEGEQLQPLVHVGQFSEGEFAAPGVTMPGVDHLATMYEIPDNIFDSCDDGTGKYHDVFKRAVTGLLRSDKEPGEEAAKKPGETNDTTDGSNSDGQNGAVISQGSHTEDISRSEGEVDRDVMAVLLQKIRRPPPPRMSRAPQSLEPGLGIHDSPSVGELLQEDEYLPVWRKLPKISSVDQQSPEWRPLPKMSSGQDISPGELNVPKRAGLNVTPLDDTMSRPQGSSVFDSDENNNESERSNGVADLQNETWDNTSYNTPKKTSSPPDVTPYESTSTTAFPRILQVTEARRDNAAQGSFLGSSLGKNKPSNESDVTMVTIPDIETGLLDASHTTAQTPRVELTLPSSELRTPELSEEPLSFENDDTFGEASSISCGELP